MPMHMCTHTYTHMMLARANMRVLYTRGECYSTELRPPCHPFLLNTIVPDCVLIAMLAANTLFSGNQINNASRGIIPQEKSTPQSQLYGPPFGNLV